jgi:hypothetical protein
MRIGFLCKCWEQQASRFWAFCWTFDLIFYLYLRWMWGAINYAQEFDEEVETRFFCYRGRGVRHVRGESETTFKGEAIHLRRRSTVQPRAPSGAVWIGGSFRASCSTIRFFFFFSSIFMSVTWLVMRSVARSRGEPIVSTSTIVLTWTDCGTRRVLLFSTRFGAQLEACLLTRVHQWWSISISRLSSPSKSGVVFPDLTMRSEGLFLDFLLRLPSGP